MGEKEEKIFTYPKTYGFPFRFKRYSDEQCEKVVNMESITFKNIKDVIGDGFVSRSIDARNYQESPQIISNHPEYPEIVLEESGPLHRCRYTLFLDEKEAPFEIYYDGIASEMICKPDVYEQNNPAHRELLKIVTEIYKTGWVFRQAKTEEVSLYETKELDVLQDNPKYARYFEEDRGRSPLAIGGDPSYYYKKGNEIFNKSGFRPQLTEKDIEEMNQYVSQGLLPEPMKEKCST